MRVIPAVVVGAVFSAGLMAGGALTARTTAQQAPFGQCGQASAPQVRTTLYFGTARPKGSVSELEAFDQQAVLWETARVCVAS